MPSTCGARAPTLDDWVRLVWREGRNAIFTPTTARERELAIACLAAAGNVVALIDEAWLFINAHARADDPLVGAMRTHKHRRLSFVLTTQHLSGDVPAAAFSCAPRICVFRCKARPVLDRVEAEFDLPRDEVRNLPQFEYLETMLGFS